MALPPPKEVSRQREREAWLLRQEGWTEERIAEHLGVNQSSVSRMLDRIEERLAVEFVEKAANVKARQSARLEMLYAEALVQWRRSCQDAETTVTTTGKTTGRKTKDGQDADQSRAQVVRTVQGQSGNPSLLAQIRGMMADQRAIWGLEAPQRREHSGPDGEPIEFRTAGDDLDRKLARLAASLEADRAVDGLDPGGESPAHLSLGVLVPGEPEGA